MHVEFAVQQLQLALTPGSVPSLDPWENSIDGNIWVCTFNYMRVFKPRLDLPHKGPSKDGIEIPLGYSTQCEHSVGF